ncbi:MAG: response regulator [Phycisphaerae bacterium]|nr:response regulator [Phycisphaerae bacterium]
MNAMVVDDSGIMRKMVMRGLNDCDLAEFSFTEAVDGKDALDKFDSGTHEMLFVDWNMPNMNGLEFIIEVRKQTDHHIPVVMITTESTMGKVEEAMEKAGVDTFICKPFTPDVLQKKLQPLFEKIEGDAKAGGDFFGALAGKF